MNHEAVAAVLNMTNLSHLQFRILMMIAANLDPDGVFRGPITGIAKACGIARSAASRALSDLAQMHVVDRPEGSTNIRLITPLDCGHSVTSGNAGGVTSGYAVPTKRGNTVTSSYASPGGADVVTIRARIDSSSAPQSQNPKALGIKNKRPKLLAQTSEPPPKKIPDPIALQKPVLDWMNSASGRTLRATESKAKHVKKIFAGLAAHEIADGAAFFAWIWTYHFRGSDFARNFEPETIGRHIDKYCDWYTAAIATAAPTASAPRAEDPEFLAWQARRQKATAP